MKKRSCQVHQDFERGAVNSRKVSSTQLQGGSVVDGSFGLFLQKKLLKSTKDWRVYDSYS
jgi:hypothetical protein